ncbi:MAG: hypothetical protein ACI9I0_000722 [Rhodoferax sp.]
MVFNISPPKKVSCQKLFPSETSSPEKGLNSNVWLHLGIDRAHGFSASTSSSLRNRFPATGPEGCSFQFNALASLGRCKLSFEAPERAVTFVKTQALTLAGIMVKLKAGKLVPKSETNGRYALADTLKRTGMSVQRTRYSLKKARPPAV